MQRRDILRLLLVNIGAAAAAPHLLADQQCSPIVVQPVPTPFGFQPHRMQQCTAGMLSISVVQAYQEMDEWCWAASISMVFAFYGHPVDQKRIVSETWGSIQNMPAENGTILQDLNRSWKDERGVPFRSMGDMLSVNVETAVQDLQAGHPLIIGALGHATVLTALTSNIDLSTGQWGVVAATVRDPWPTNGGKRILSPQEWTNIQFAARVRCV